MKRKKRGLKHVMVVVGEIGHKNFQLQIWVQIMIYSVSVTKLSQNVCEAPAIYFHPILEWVGSKNAPMAFSLQIWAQIMICSMSVTTPRKIPSKYF